MGVGKCVPGKEAVRLENGRRRVQETERGWYRVRQRLVNLSDG